MSGSTTDILKSQLGLTDQQLSDAEERSAKDGVSFMHALELQNYVPEEKLLDVFSKIHKRPKTNLGAKDIPANIIALVPADIAQTYRVIPIDKAGNNVIVAMGYPKIQTLEQIRFKTGFQAQAVIASEIRISEALKKYYSKVTYQKVTLDTSNLEKDLATAGVTLKKETIKREIIDLQAANAGPIVKLVNQILIECKNRGASDIHIEPYENYMRVRLRVDGVLTEIARPDVAAKGPLISRIKIMSKLDIAETRLPQDGAINIQIGDKPVDFRVSSCPTAYGEKIVLRILDKSALAVDMTALGFDQEELDKFKASIHSPFGMVLVTGPTGSGKTTTLYSALSELNQESDNVMTAEDPVEYNLDGINQVQMKNDIGLDFAAALKSFLRQDPDIIMVGEIRDIETANIAIKAALTGHMVLSTLHTNSAPDTIARLMNMGVEGFNLVSALTCITAQRLVRKICNNCRVVDDSVSTEAMVSLGIHPSFAPRVKAYKGSGCPTCSGSGNKGRVAVHEVLKLSDPVREAILRGAPAMEIKRVAMMNGMRSLRQSALNKMVQGLCNATEVVKTTAADSDEGSSTESAA